MTLGDCIGASVCVLAILGVIGGCIAGWRMEYTVQQNRSE